MHSGEMYLATVSVTAGGGHSPWYVHGADGTAGAPTGLPGGDRRCAKPGQTGSRQPLTSGWVRADSSGSLLPRDREGASHRKNHYICLCTRWCKRRGHMQQSQSRFPFVSGIFCIIARCIWLAGRCASFAHAGRALFLHFQACVPFLPGLAAPGVRPAAQVEGLLHEPGCLLSRFGKKILSHRGPLPNAGRPSLHSARSFIPYGLSGPGLGCQPLNGGPSKVVTQLAARTSLSQTRKWATKK